MRDRHRGQVLRTEQLRMAANKMAYFAPDTFATRDAMLCGRLNTWMPGACASSPPPDLKDSIAACQTREEALNHVKDLIAGFGVYSDPDLGTLGLPLLDDRGDLLPRYSQKHNERPPSRVPPSKPPISRRGDWERSGHPGACNGMLACPSLRLPPVAQSLLADRHSFAFLFSCIALPAPTIPRFLSKVSTVQIYHVQ